MLAWHQSHPGAIRLSFSPNLQRLDLSAILENLTNRCLVYSLFEVLDECCMDNCTLLQS